MANVETFKEFVKKNPSLIKYVRTGDMTWQKFYEIYDLYGEEEGAWKEYLRKEEPKTEPAKAAATLGLADVMGWVKNIDLDSVQSGVGSLQRVLGLLQDFKGKDPIPTKEAYKPRPIYKHFED